MPTIQRVFSITDEISNNLNQSIPNQERSKFVTKVLAEALQKRKREQLINIIDKLEPSQKSENEKSIVEVIRDIRKTESKRITGNL